MGHQEGLDALQGRDPAGDETAAGEAVAGRRRLAETLRRRQGEIPNLRAFIGFDGFVDEIVRVVATRTGPDTFTPMENLQELAERIEAAAGLSANIELVVERVKLGGNAPIMALALARLGVKTTCVGCLGEPDLHPVFHALTEAGVETISLGPPAHTDALEFRDGKLMLGKLAPLRQVTWERVMEKVGMDRLVQLARECHLVAQLNWTMLPHLNEIWDGWRQHLAREARGIFFVDLADPEKRPLAQLRQGLASLGKLARHQPVYLGLNWREALAVHAAVVGRDAPSSRDKENDFTASQPAGETTHRLARELGPALGNMGIAGILLHPVRNAAGWRRHGDREETAWVEGAYAARPRLATGAGDNFNAGAALGLCLDLPLRDVLWLGKAAAGYYVRHGESPDLSQLIGFLETWDLDEVYTL